MSLLSTSAFKQTEAQHQELDSKDIRQSKLVKTARSMEKEWKEEDAFIAFSALLFSNRNNILIIGFPVTVGSQREKKNRLN